MNNSTARESDNPLVADAMCLMDEAFAQANPPIDMVLHCPACGLQHIDAPSDDAYDGNPPTWTNPPHRSHLCHGCGHIWRPADVPTNGVAEIKTRGKNDSPIATSRAKDFLDQTVGGMAGTPGY